MENRVLSALPLEFQIENVQISANTIVESLNFSKREFQLKISPDNQPQSPSLKPCHLPFTSALSLIGKVLRNMLGSMPSSVRDLVQKLHSGQLTEEECLNMIQICRLYSVKNPTKYATMREVLDHEFTFEPISEVTHVRHVYKNVDADTATSEIENQEIKSKRRKMIDGVRQFQTMCMERNVHMENSVL